ncbi:MAG: sugar kinase [Oscillospiraceae bacterium]|nr:sugar kinase [Oscillospiraceae bacterium]
MNNKILAFGEIMLRLTPPSHALISETRAFDACYGGTESNVMVCLSCLGHKTEYITALPADDLGDATIRHLRSYGVETDHIIRSGDRMGLYFLEEGQGERATKVIYMRKGSEASKLDENAFDLDDIFEGCSLFHISGISFAISEGAKRLSFQLLKEAKRRSIPVSFDFNYRGKLWSTDEAAEVYKEIINYVDIVFCAEKDLTTFLGTTRELFHSRFVSPVLIVRERQWLSDSRCAVSLYASRKTEDGVKSFSIENTEFSAYEKIGSGDAFAAGVLHILSDDMGDLENALRWGLGCFVLKHSQRGDVLSQSKSAIEAYITNFSKDVSR